MKLSGLLIGLMSLGATVANATEVTGKIILYDCSQVIVKPANPNFANGCVVVFTGGRSGVSADGTRWTNESTQIATSSQSLYPKIEAALSSGATVIMNIDFDNAALVDLEVKK